MTGRQADKQTDGRTNRTDFKGPLPQRWRFNVFQKFKNKVFLIIWVDCKPHGKNQYKKKEHNQHSSVFKEFKNNDP